MRQLDLLRFWSKVCKADGRNGCWQWTAGRDTRGYGVLKVDGVQSGAHRLSWELHRAPLQDGISVLHHCDTPACVRPDHLFLGTQGDNMADMVAKGRQVKGAQHSHAKLTDDQARAILADGRIHRLIAAEYGLHRRTVDRIKRGELWRHLDAA